MLRNCFSATVVGLFLLGAAGAAAQVNVTLQLPFKQMPARVAEWRDNESLIRIAAQNTGRDRLDGLMLSVELSKDGRRIARSRDGHPAQPRWSLGPNETRSLSWREVINEEAIEYDGSIRQQVLATGELPEGQYQLCIQVLNAQLRPISQQQCGSFGIVLADPPVLVSPIGGASVSPMPLLEWTPSNPPAPGLQYQVTVKVRYRGQTPAQAMANNPVRLQATVPTTSYQVPVAQQLGADATDPNYAGHVWQVQALLNGRPYGRNRGLSQIEWFIVPGIVVDPVKPGDGRPIAVLEWEVPYEDLASGRPINLEVPPMKEDTVLYVLRVRVPEKLPPQQWKPLGYGESIPVDKDRGSQDTLVVQGRYTGGYFLYRTPQGTLIMRESDIYAIVSRSSHLYDIVRFELSRRLQDTSGVAGVSYSFDPSRPYPGGYYLYGLPQDTTEPAQLAGYYAGGYFLYRTLQDTTKPTPEQPPVQERQIAYNAGVEGAIIADRKSNMLVIGNFTPTHIGLPMPELELDPGDGPICALPVSEGTQPNAGATQAIKIEAIMT